MTPKLIGQAVCAALALVFAAPAVQAQGSWACEESALSAEQANYDKLTNGSHALEQVVIEYSERWDAAYVRTACEQFAGGEPAYIGCLNGRRDWDAIKAMIPDDYFGMSKEALRPHYLQLQDEGNGIREAVKFCRSVGAIE